mmetsp:Transcript_126811/g.370739  ORF Transcript_126811/g.370739 Transcript_126811/m.370739 type:complete len:375 (+) Transcript_126811:73-1197(+)
MEVAGVETAMLPDVSLDEEHPHIAGQRPSRLHLLLVTLACSSLLAFATCFGRNPPPFRTGGALTFQRKFELASCRERCHTTYNHGRSKCGSISNWNVKEKATCISEAATLRVHCETMCLKGKASCLGVWIKGASKRKLCVASCYKHLDNDKTNSCIEKDCDARLERELSEAGCEAPEVPGDCQDTRADHHYRLPGKTLRHGLPDGYQPLGSQMTKCELYELQKYCVDAINSFRAGRPFSDGRTRDHGELPFLKLSGPEVLQCSNEKALSDLKYSNDGAGCGHHSFDLDCGLDHWTGAENSCCTRSCSSIEECKKTLDGCLQQMWDEGQIVLDGDTEYNHKTGHYYNMLSKNTHVSCGFGFDDDGKVLATQQFSR